MNLTATVKKLLGVKIETTYENWSTWQTIPIILNNVLRSV